MHLGPLRCLWIRLCSLALHTIFRVGFPVPGLFAIVQLVVSSYECVYMYIYIYIYYKMHINIYICTYITHVHNFRHKILIVSSMASTKTRHSRPGRGGKGKKDKQLDARHQCGRCFSWKLGVFLRTGEFTGIFKGGIYGYESKYKVWIKALDPHTIHTPRSIP